MAQLRVLVLTNMYPTPEHPAFGTFVSDQVSSLRWLGVECDVLFLNPRESKLNYLWGPRRLRRHLGFREYDLIHAHYVFSGLIAATQRRLPVVLTQHGPEVFMYWTPPLCRLAARLADATIVVSPALAKYMPVPVTVIPCGVDLELFQPQPQAEARKALALSPQRKLVLFASEMRPEKHVEIAQAAVQRLQAAGEPVDLVITTGQPHERIPLYMNACDVLVLPSAGEGSPMVIKEALACNLPIVSTDVGDVADLIDGVEGCYLCERTVDDVADKLRLALAFGRRTAGRRRVEARFSQRRVAEQIVNVYEETLRHHGR